jgi:hypothetical protein
MLPMLIMTLFQSGADVSYGKIYGKVITAHDKPAPYTLVLLEENDLLIDFTFADKNGEYALFPLPGKYCVTTLIRATKGSAHEKVVVKAGESAFCNLKLEMDSVPAADLSPEYRQQISTLFYERSGVNFTDKNSRKQGLWIGKSGIIEFPLVQENFMWKGVFVDDKLSGQWTFNKLVQTDSLLKQLATPGLADISHEFNQQFVDTLGNAEPIVRWEGRYVEGKKEGVWQYYDEGSVFKEITYKNGVAVHVKYNREKRKER